MQLITLPTLHCSNKMHQMHIIIIHQIIALYYTTLSYILHLLYYWLLSVVESFLGS